MLSLAQNVPASNQASAVILPGGCEGGLATVPDASEVVFFFFLDVGKGNTVLLSHVVFGKEQHSFAGRSGSSGQK